MEQSFSSCNFFLSQSKNIPENNHKNRIIIVRAFIPTDMHGNVDALVKLKPIKKIFLQAKIFF